MSRDKDQQQAVTPPVVRLAAAEVDAVAAKDRLNDTVARLQSKLDPKLLAKEATDEAKRYGREGAELARDNRELLIGLAGGALLYLLRKPILGLFRRRPYPKPQKAARPMTAAAPHERLAREPHPAQAPLAPQSPSSVHHATITPPAAAVGDKGAQLQGTTI